MNFIEYLKSHWIYVTICIIFIILSCFALTLFPSQTPQEAENQEIFILGITLNNWGIWLTIIATIIASIWALYQYNKSVIKKQQERASEIAKSFSDNLAFKCSIIYGVLENSDIAKLLELDKKNYDSFKVFNTNEIRSVYSNDNFIEKYKKVYNSSNLDKIYYRILNTRISSSSFQELNLENKEYTDSEARGLFILTNSEYPFHFDELVSGVLNELEYLCMNLSSQAADSKYVYQSLHQMFLRTIRLLCVEISMSNNKSYSDKYYTNLIYVYNEWTNLYMKDLEIEKKKKEKINKILNPKIKTV